MKTKHTPGNWYHSENGRDTYIYLEDGGNHHKGMIGKVSKQQNEYEANAKLIAAAPELLEILMKIDMSIDEASSKITGHRMFKVWPEIQVAIQKATS